MQGDPETMRMDGREREWAGSYYTTLVSPLWRPVKRYARSTAARLLLLIAAHNDGHSLNDPELYQLLN